MTMSAAAASIVVMVMLVIAATAIMIAATASIVMIATSVTTAAASASHVLDKVLNLLLSSFAVLNNAALEVKSLASERVVGVNSNTIFLNLGYLSHKLVLFVIHQSDNSSFEDILVVEVPVNGEHLAAHLVYTLSDILAKSLCRSKLEVEVATFLKSLHLLLESIECYAESCDKLKWALVACLLLQLALAILEAIQLVDNRHKSVLCFFHIPIYIYYLVSACKDTHFPLNTRKFNPKI